MNRTTDSTAPRSRQEIVLCVLLDEAPHPLRGRTYIQKLLFLCQQHAGEQWFRFEPYDYGPFSQDVYFVLDYCIEYDYITEREVEDDHGRIHYHYTAGPAISDVFGASDHDELRTVASEVYEAYPTDDLQALLEAVYTEYPQWARNSVF